MKTYSHIETDYDPRIYIEFDRHLMRGTFCIVRWTNCGNQWEAPAWVSKVNPKSVRATLQEGIEGHYPAGQEIIVPRPMCKTWSQNNCVAPKD